VDLLRGASFVGEISPLEDLALLLGKQGLTHFSAYWIRCKGRPAYITVNEPLTLNNMSEEQAMVLSAPKYRLDISAQSC
jgi:hypothetical protein